MYIVNYGVIIVALMFADFNFYDYNIKTKYCDIHNINTSNKLFTGRCNINTVSRYDSFTNHTRGHTKIRPDKPTANIFVL